MFRSSICVRLMMMITTIIYKCNYPVFNTRFCKLADYNLKGTFLHYKKKCSKIRYLAKKHWILFGNNWILH